MANFKPKKKPTTHSLYIKELPEKTEAEDKAAFAKERERNGVRDRAAEENAATRKNKKVVPPDVQGEDDTDREEEEIDGNVKPLTDVEKIRRRIKKGMGKY